MTTTQQLYEKLQILTTRFASLPESIPESTEDTSQFCIDPEDVLDMGTSGALNKVFHRMWGYKDQGIKVVSRGSRLSTTLELLEKMIPVADDRGIVGLWIDALDEAAEAAGGLVSKMGTQTITTADYCLRVQGKRQSTLSFAKIPLKEYHEQVRNRAERTREQRTLERAQALEETAKVERQKREKERLRKRDYRARSKAKQRATVIISDDSDASGTESTDTDESSDDPSRTNVSIVSLFAEVDWDSPAMTQKNETARRAWKGSRTAERHARAEKKRGSEVRYRVNWQDHFLWQQISAAQERTKSWSPQEIVTELYRTNPGTFEPVKGVKSGLYKATLAKWIDQNQKKWKSEVLARVAAGGRQGITRRSTVLVRTSQYQYYRMSENLITWRYRVHTQRSRTRLSRNSGRCDSLDSRSVNPSLLQSPVLTFSTTFPNCLKNSRSRMHGLRKFCTMS